LREGRRKTTLLELLNSSLPARLPVRDGKDKKGGGEGGKEVLRGRSLPFFQMRRNPEGEKKKKEKEGSLRRGKRGGRVAGWPARHLFRTGRVPRERKRGRSRPEGEEGGGEELAVPSGRWRGRKKGGGKGTRREGLGGGADDWAASILSKRLDT